MSLKTKHCCLCSKRLDQIKNKNEIRHVNDKVDVLNQHCKELLELIKKPQRPIQIQRDDLICPNCRGASQRFGL